jgi:hypothetical protein
MMQLDDVEKAQALGAVRTLIALGAGFLVGHGYFNEMEATEFAGAVAALVPLVWGFIEKRTSETKTQVRVAEASTAAYEAGSSQMPKPTVKS